MAVHVAQDRALELTAEIRRCWARIAELEAQIAREREEASVEGECDCWVCKFGF